MKLIKPLLLAGAIAFGTGCSTFYTPEKRLTIVNKPLIEAEIGTELGMKFAHTNYKGITQDMRFVPIHPGDKDDSMGGAGIYPNADKEIDWKLFVGPRLKLGNESFKAYTGIDLGYIVPEDTPKEHLKKQNVSYPHDAYGYALMQKRDSYYSPVIGIEKKIGGEIILQLQKSWPTHKFDFEAGHYRWNNYRAIREESEKIRGHGYSVGIFQMPQSKYDVKWGIRWNQEKHNFEMLGRKIKSRSNEIEAIFEIRF